MNGSQIARPMPVALLAGYAVVVGAVSALLGAGSILDGETPAIGRSLIGLVGLAGGALLWTRPQRGGFICLVWAVLQIPYVVWNLDGSPTTQLIEVPLSASSTTSRNGVITSESAIGINLVGVALAILAAKVRSVLVMEGLREEARRANEMPSADRTLREIEAMRQAGTITREEANQRRLAVLKSLPTTQDSDPDSQRPT
jgi:hypothetical protein